MKTNFLFFSGIVFLGLMACNSQNQSSSQEADPSKASADVKPTLQLKWSTDTLLRTPESVLFDAQNNLIYVANVNENPWEMDGNGFISRLDMQGNIIDLEWATGLNGPKGMALLGQKLYVADVSQIVEIDVQTGSITQTFPGEGKPTFNDMTHLNGRLFISGSDSQKIFELKDGSLTEFLSGELGRPNGLYAEPNRLLMLTSGSSQLEAIDYQTKSRTTLATGLGHGDGIVPAGDGAYLASSWRGQLFYIDSEGASTVLLNTEEESINSADIDYSIEKNLLFVPTFFDNRVVAYELVF